MSLRGRSLKGQTLDLPEGFIGLQITQGVSEAGSMHSYDDDEMDGDRSHDDEEEGEGGQPGHKQRRGKPGKKWEATRSFSSVMLWGHDQPPTRSDATRRVLDYLSIASKVHAPVPKSQIDDLISTRE